MTQSSRNSLTSRIRVRACLAALASVAVLGGVQRPAPSLAATVTTIYDFGRNTQNYPTDPAFDLLEYRGSLYGITALGGSHVQGQQETGTIYKISPATGKETTLSRFPPHFFSTPLAELNGIVYAVADTDDTFGPETIYKLDPLTRAMTLLYSFSPGDGAIAGPLTAYEGMLYGTLNAANQNCPCKLFRFDPASNTTTFLHVQAPGEGVPLGDSLVANGSFLYGTGLVGGANNEGTVFKFDLAAGTETTIYNFHSNGLIGARPEPGLTIHGNRLFGTAGQYTANSIFSINLQTGGASSLYTFTPNSTLVNGPLLFRDGALYGTTNSETHKGGDRLGKIFKLDITTRQLTTLFDFPGPPGGAEPSSSLVYVQGAFYGTTAGGGTYHHGGTLFKLVP